MLFPEQTEMTQIFNQLISKDSLQRKGRQKKFQASCEEEEESTEETSDVYPRFLTLFEEEQLKKAQARETVQQLIDKNRSKKLALQLKSDVLHALWICILIKISEEFPFVSKIILFLLTLRQTLYFNMYMTILKNQK